VTDLDDLCPQNSEDRDSPVQLPRSLELERRGLTLTLADDVNYEYEIADHTLEELRSMATSINRIEFTPNQFTVFDNVEIKTFTDFLTSQEHVTSKL